MRVGEVDATVKIVRVCGQTYPDLATVRGTGECGCPLSADAGTYGLLGAPPRATIEPVGCIMHDKGPIFVNVTCGGAE